MKTFTCLTNNPPLAAQFTVRKAPGNSTLALVDDDESWMLGKSCVGFQVWLIQRATLPRSEERSSKSCFDVGERRGG